MDYRKIYFLLALLIFMNVSLLGRSYANSELTVVVDGTTVEFPVSPIIKNGTSLVPLRAIFEAMGADVSWKQEKRQVQAKRNEIVISLTVNSQKAYRNSQEVILQEPAMIHYDSTLVPLRFIGEAFGHVVHWDQASKTATVRTKQEVTTPIHVIDHLELVIDGFHLENVNVLVIKEGRSYLPILNIHEILPSDELVSINKEAIINYKGEQYVSTHDVAKKLNATMFWDNEMKRLVFDTPNLVFGLKQLPVEMRRIAQPVNISHVKLIGDRRLMVSDNPEELNQRTLPAADSTLWHDHVTSSKKEMNHRIFAHHINKFSQPLVIGVTIENLSKTNTIEIVGLKGVRTSSSRGWVLHDVGIPLAGFTLSDNLSSIEMEKKILQSGETGILDHYLVEHQHLIGFLQEFTIKKHSGVGELNYKVRVVVSNSLARDLSTIKGLPVPFDGDNRHPRGSWSQSIMEAELPVYTIGTGEKSFNISNRHGDHLLQANTSFDSTRSLDNFGHFGANYKLFIPIQNNTQTEQTVTVRLSPRGGRYAGAIKTPEGIFTVPTLTPGLEVAKVIDYKVEPGMGILELELFHASGAALPIAVTLNVD